MEINQIILHTPRLILRLPKETDVEKIQSFDERNLKHLSSWSTSSKERNTNYQTQLLNWKEDFSEGRSIRFLMFIREELENETIGFCNFSQIFRGPFQACYLGYQIDVAFEGLGYMSEAVGAAINYMFEKQNIHRIMANYMPANIRSARLLKKLGFVVEGTAKKYLLINGQWEDHVLTALTNDGWVP